MIIQNILLLNLPDVSVAPVFYMGKTIPNIQQQVKQYNKNMELIKEYPSITEAVLETKIKSISNVLTGRAKTAGGYIWL